MRPRANTISHVDGEALQNMMAANNFTSTRNTATGSHSRHPSLAGFPMHGDYQFAGMTSLPNQRGLAQGLPKLETHGFTNMDFGGGLRTAPPIGGFGQDFDFEGLLFSGSTINPNALHYSDSPQAMAIDSTSPYHQGFLEMTSSHENYDWMTGFQDGMNFSGVNDNAIDGSSPSAISTASQSGVSDGVMVDGSNNPAVSAASMWHQSMMAPPLVNPNPFTLEIPASGFPDLFNGGSISPHANPPRNANDPYFSTPPPSMSSLSPSIMPALATQGIPLQRSYGPETPSSTNSNSQPSSPLATITEATRQSLVMALARCTPFGSRKYSFPAVSSPLSPHFPGRSNSVSDSTKTLPSTADLQRYVAAYIQYFQPHLPFLHIPTLSFDIPAPTSHGLRNSEMVGGSGCLLLSMAAIGALYEMEQVQSKELFDSAKKMIQLYLEERRKSDVRKADMRKAGVANHIDNSQNSVHTPVWLVQAMLLNVVYGHNCGDKTAGDIASTHCAALVSLARAAELLRPQEQQDSHMTEDEPMSDTWNGIKQEASEDQIDWHTWKTNEERKRTLYGVFILSSLLVSAYNHTPALTNSEVLLDLPCDEEFWTADSSANFRALGGARMADHNRMTFHDALAELLRSSETQQHQTALHQPFGSTVNIHDLPKSDLKPSTFGCLVLINALHNYIWETRQRHHNKIWTNEETEKMHRSIEPALKAWQAAWASNPHHSLERPNPYGLGPLSADSIPLLDLAYVRLFVNLARSKEKFWKRDFDGMAEELSRGSEIIQHAEHSPSSNVDSSTDPSETSGSSTGFGDSPRTSASSPDFTKPSGMAYPSASSSSKRERHLRKAAFYAADSLSMSDRLGVTFADFTSRELPLQSAMCAFDCAQVLAEWVTTVQERVGRYLGILGKDDIDLTQVPAIMLLEEEDGKLLGKIQEVLHSAEIKMNLELSGTGASTMAAQQRLPIPDNSGYGAKILRVTAYMLDKAAAWPGKNIVTDVKLRQKLTHHSNSSHGSKPRDSSKSYACES